MGLRITTNVASMNAQRSFGVTQREMNKNFAALSSGSRITKAADDAAGLGISEGMKSQIRGYGQAKRNAMDAVSLLQVSEGGLGEISNILNRLRELGVQAASDTVSDRERGFIDKEVQQLKSEAQRIAQATRFGNSKLLDGSGGIFSFQVDINNNEFQDRITFDAGAQDARTTTLGVDDLNFQDKEGARVALEAIDLAQTKVNEFRANLGAVQNRLFSTQDYLGVAEENLSAANSRIRDTDIAQSTSELTRNNILMNASTAILGQANQVPGMALKLING